MTHAAARGCPDADTIVRYLAGDLRDRASEIEDHVDGCAECRSLFAQLARTSLGPGAAVASDERPVPLSEFLPAGATVGRYQIVAPLGRGGMGMVYEAHDEELDRTVALKVLRTELAALDGARLVTEARAMAGLSHPNVCPVYDIGLVDERPYVVMECATGGTLDAWLHAEPRSTADVIAAFVAAGEGLAAAHAIGVIHRDFKPSNVLTDERGRMMVCDFGLAAQHHDSAAPGAGSPLYMAPEQHRGQRLSSAADQYAFCIALWTELAGAPPFETPALASRKERGPPPWPSRARAPRRIVAALRRGLAPEPDARWPTMRALLDELTATVATRRFGWALPVAGVGVAGLGLTAALGVGNTPPPCTGAAEKLSGTWGPERYAAVQAAFEATKLPYAGAAWGHVAPTLDQYAADWVTIHTETCLATSERQEQSVELLDLRMACLERARRSLAAAADVLSAGDAQAVQNASRIVQRLPPLARCSDAEAMQADTAPPLPWQAEAVAEIRTAVAVARTEVNASRHEAAQHSLALAEAALRDVEYAPVAAEVALARGILDEAQGRYEPAAASLRRAMHLGTIHQQTELVREATARLMLVLASRQSRPEEALRYRGLLVGLSRDDAALGTKHDILGALAAAQGDFATAVVEDRKGLALRVKALGEGHYDVGVSRANLAEMLRANGEYAESEALNRELLAQRIEAYGESHPSVAASRGNLSAVLLEQGKYDAAEPLIRAALRVGQAHLGPDHPDVALMRHNLAGILTALGRGEEAIEQSRLALRALAAAVDPDHADIARFRATLGNALVAEGRYAEAEVEIRTTLRHLQQTVGEAHPNVAVAHGNLASILTLTGDLPRAEQEFRTALRLMVDALGQDHPLVAATRTNLAEILLELGRPHEARPFAERAWARRKRGDGPPAGRANTAFVLARTLGVTPGGLPASDEAAQRQRARDLVELAVETWATTGPVHAERRAEAQAWLDEH
ncbi:MAG: serine/threonine-protein kinase [Myxococcota bacterium]